MNPVLSFAADDIQINTAKIEYSDDTYKLLTSFSLAFNHSLEETLSHGIPLYFKTEIEINRPRTFWFDEVPVSKSRTDVYKRQVDNYVENKLLTDGQPSIHAAYNKMLIRKAKKISLKNNIL